MKWPGSGTLIATCGGGAEPYLELELRANGLTPLLRENGAVHFSGALPELTTANRQLRTASRILLPVLSGKVGSYDDLYRLTRTLDWSTIIGAKQTLRVSAVTRSSRLSDASFAAVRVKDAITDSQRAKVRDRSSVSKRHADVLISAFVTRDQAMISLDSSGRPLHERGYRVEAGPAPLRETLAATVLAAAEWDGEAPLLDPFCGSGTIAIEAALRAVGKSPGELRSQFAFSRWQFTDAGSRQRKPRASRPDQETTRPASRTRIRITATDSDPEMIKIARRNADRAGVSDLIEFSTKDISKIGPQGDRGLVVTNPPYGERMEESEAAAVMTAFGRAAKESLPGWRVYFLSAGRAGAKSIGLRTNLVAELYNGGMRTNLYRADIFANRRPSEDEVRDNR